jgi:hypothetical protein
VRRCCADGSARSHLFGAVFATDFRDTTFIKPWLDEGAAFHLRVKRRSANGRSSTPRLRQHIAAARLIAAAADTGLPVLATGAERDGFEVYAQRRVEHAICDLLTQYRRLEDRMVQNLLRYQLLRPRYLQFKIPPIPLQILRRCNSVHDIARATLEVRAELAGLRRQFAELNYVLSDSSVDYKRRLREIRKIEAAWAAVEKTIDGYALVNFSNSAGYMLNAVSSSAQAAYGYLAASPSHATLGGAGVVGNFSAAVMSAFGERARAWRLEPMYQAFDQCLRTSDDEVMRHLQRLFGRPE